MDSKLNLMLPLTSQNDRCSVGLRVDGISVCSVNSSVASFGPCILQVFVEFVRYKATCLQFGLFLFKIK